MLLNILRWLKGYVCFVINGRFPERFINVVTKSGLSIWNTKRSDGELYACMYVRDYKNIRPLARKSRVTLKTHKRIGFPFFVKKYKSRVGVLLGIAVFIAIASFLSNFVWTIEVTGLQTISEAEVLQVLGDNGLKVGTYKPSSSFKIIGRDTMLQLDDIGWMSINVLGSHASVEIKEKAKSPQVDNYHQPANVKAERDGLILRINVSEGESFFNAGSAVVKDQMIVSSVIEDELGGVTLVRANAEVIAQTKREQTFEIAKNQPRYSYSEPIKRYEFNVLGINFPLSLSFADDKDCLICYQNTAVSLFDTTLPLQNETQFLYKRQLLSDKLSESTAQSVLMSRASLYEAFELSECVVTDRVCEFSQTDTHYVLKVSYTCEEDIAYQQDINVDNADTERIEALQKED